MMKGFPKAYTKPGNLVIATPPFCLPPWAGYPEIIIGRRLDLAGPTGPFPFPASATNYESEKPFYWFQLSISYIIGHPPR